MMRETGEQLLHCSSKKKHPVRHENKLIDDEWNGDGCQCKKEKQVLKFDCPFVFPISLKKNRLMNPKISSLCLSFAFESKNIYLHRLQLSPSAHN